MKVCSRGGSVARRSSMRLVDESDSDFQSPNKTADIGKKNEKDKESERSLGSDKENRKRKTKEKINEDETELIESEDIERGRKEHGKVNESERNGNKRRKTKESESGTVESGKNKEKQKKSKVVRKISERESSVSEDDERVEKGGKKHGKGKQKEIHGRKKMKTQGNKQYGNGESSDRETIDSGMKKGKKQKGNQKLKTKKKMSEDEECGIYGSESEEEDESEKKVVDSRGDSRGYRLNVHATWKLLDDLKKQIRVDHKNVMKYTPFYHFWCAFLDGKVNKDNITQSGQVINDIVQRYNPRKKSFKIGQGKVRITTRDLELIFGISSRQTPVTIGTHTKKPKTDFIKISTIHNK